MPLLLTAGCKHCHVHLNPWANVWEQGQSIWYHKTLQELSQIEDFNRNIWKQIEPNVHLERPDWMSKLSFVNNCHSCQYSTNKILHLKETKILLQLFSLQKYAVFMFMTPRGLLNLILGNICDHLKCIQLQWSAASSVVS